MRDSSVLRTLDNLMKSLGSMYIKLLVTMLWLMLPRMGFAVSESELRILAAQFPAMPRDTVGLIPFKISTPTFGSGAPFNDIQFTILDTDYMDGENSGYDIFLPVDPSAPFPGSDRVQLIRCALNTDLDQVYGSASGDRIILGTAEIAQPFFLKGIDGIDNDYCVILHFDYEFGHIQLRGAPEDFRLVYCTPADGVATEGWFLFYIAGGAPDLIAFIFPVDDIEPSVSGNPPTNPTPYGAPGTALDLSNPVQFRYAVNLPVEPVVPGGIAQFGSDGKEIVGGFAVDSGGNSYLVGCRDKQAGNLDGTHHELFVTRVGADGLTDWVTPIAAGEGTMLKAAVADETHLYVAGRTLGTLEGFSNSGRWDGILLKLDLEDGEILETDQWGNAGIDGYGNLALDGAGHLFVSAQGSPPGPATNDDAYLVAKHRTSDLGLVWRQIDPVPVAGFAASAEAWGGLTFVPDTTPGATPGEGRLIVAGWYFSSTGANAFATVYEALTAPVPKRPHFLTLTAPGARAEWIMDSAVDAQGRIYFAGFTTGVLPGSGASLLGEGDAFVARYESDLANPVIRQFGTDRSDLASSIEVAADGTVHVLGYTYGDLGGANADTSGFSGDIFVRSFDADLNPIQTRQFGTVGEDRGFMILKNDQLFVAGMTEGSLVEPSAGSFDGFVLALDPDDLELADDIPPQPPFKLSIQGNGSDFVLSWPAEKNFNYVVWIATDLDEWNPLSDVSTPSFGFRELRYDIPANLIELNPTSLFRVEKSPVP